MSYFCVAFKYKKNGPGILFTIIFQKCSLGEERAWARARPEPDPRRFSSFLECSSPKFLDRAQARLGPSSNVQSPSPPELQLHKQPKSQNRHKADIRQHLLTKSFRASNFGWKNGITSFIPFTQSKLKALTS